MLQSFMVWSKGLQGDDNIVILQLLERLNVLIIFVINIRDRYDTHKKKIGNTSLPRSILVAAQS